MADLVRYLRDRSVIANTSGAWALEQALPDIERELPESVRGMIERKIAQLSEEDRKLLMAASVQGYEFDSAVVGKVQNLDADEVEERLETLERVFTFVKLISEAEFPNRTLTLRYRFVHVLYQNTLYASLRATRRMTLSREIAATLEGNYGEQRARVANELAALCEAARDYARAAEYFRLAAQQSSQVFATPEAAALARRGLALVELLPDSHAGREQELALQIVLGNALMATQGYGATEVEQTWFRARELCRQLGETAHLFPVLYGLAVNHLVRAKHRNALELGEELLGLAERQQDPAILVAHGLVASSHLYMGELTQAREHLEQSVALYQSAQYRYLTWLYGQEPGTTSHTLLAWTLWLLGYPGLALKQSQQAIQLAGEVSHANSQAFALHQAAVQHQFRRDWQQVRELAEALIALAAEQGLALWLAWGTTLRGWAMAEQRGPAEGIDELRRGIAAYQSTGAELFRTYFLGLLAEVYGKAGQVGACLTVLTEALALVEKNAERYWEAEIYRLRGELLLMDGLAAEAEQCFHQAIEIARRQQAKSLELRAIMSLSRWWQQQGKSAAAQPILAEIYGWFTEGFDTTDLQDAKALLEELSAEISFHG